MSLRRVLALMTLTLMAVGLLAAVEVQGRESVTLLVHWPKGADGFNALEEQVNEYAQLNPSVTMDLISASGGNIWEKYITMLAGGVAPDAVHAVLNSVSNLDMLMPVPEAVAQRMRKEYLPASLSLAERSGRIMGFPTEFQTAGIVYNKQIFAERGVAGAPTPASWDEYYRLAKKLTLKDSDGSTLVWGAESQRTYVEIVSYLSSNGYAIMTPDGKPQLNSPHVIDFVARLKELYDEGVLAWNAGAPTSTGRAAMAYWEPWFRVYVRQARPDLESVIGVSPIPYGKLGTSHAFAYGYQWCIMQASQNASSTLEFLQWLCMQRTDEGTTRMGNVMATLGSLPNTYADLTNQPSAKDPFITGYMKIVNDQVHVKIPNFPGANQWENVLVPQIGRIFRDLVTVIEGLEQAQTDWKARIAEATAR
jgi:ABC-type glycerol-3-phosphate transport system substrate-binding protein